MCLPFVVPRCFAFVWPKEGATAQPCGCSLVHQEACSPSGSCTERLIYYSTLAYFLLYAEGDGFRITLCTGMSAAFASVVTIMVYMCAFFVTPEDYSTPLWLTPECLLLTGCVLFCLLHEGVPVVLALLPDSWLEWHQRTAVFMQSTFSLARTTDAPRLATCVWFLPVAVTVLLGTAISQDVLQALGTDEALLLLPRCVRLVVTAIYLAVVASAPVSAAPNAAFGWVCVALLGMSMFLQVFGLRLSLVRLISDGLLLAGCVLFCLLHTDPETVASLLPLSLDVPRDSINTRLQDALPFLTPTSVSRLATCVWFLPIAVLVLLGTAISQDILTASAAREAWTLLPRTARIAATAAYLAVISRATELAAIEAATGWTCVGMLAASMLLQTAGFARIVARSCAQPRTIPAAVPVSTKHPDDTTDAVTPYAKTTDGTSAAMQTDIIDINTVQFLHSLKNTSLRARK